jgi:hypothetical protein
LTSFTRAGVFLHISIKSFPKITGINFLVGGVTAVVAGVVMKFLEELLFIQREDDHLPWWHSRFSSVIQLVLANKILQRFTLQAGKLRI